MRTMLSALCAVLAALLAAAALAGAQVDQLLRDEEPVRVIAGDLPEQERFADAVVSVIAEELTGQELDALPDAVGQRIYEVASAMMDEERTSQAWDETIQTTREEFDQQLQALFHGGGTGTPEDLQVAVDLSAMAQAMTQPLREALEGLLGWLPGIDESTFDGLAPEIVVDVDAVAEDGVDPYQWATAAEASRHWQVIAGAAALLGLLGLLLGTGPGRWVSLTLGGVVATGVGAWMALTVASPELTPPQPVPEAVGAVLEHVEEQFGAWAQPGWWIFVGVAGALVVVGLLGAALTGSSRAHTSQARSRPGHDDLHRV